MKFIPTCDVCHAEVQVKDDCKRCGYAYEYAYGNTRMSFDKEEIVYGYNGPHDGITRMINASLIKWRKAWQTVK